MTSSFREAFNTSMFRKKLKDVFKLCAGGGVAFCGISLYKNNEEFYKSCVMPSLHLLDPEVAHRLSIFFTKFNLVPHQQIKSRFLESTVSGLNFHNPIGVAAGYDKDGEAVEGLFKIGFGFVEIGSVTPKPQPGNSKPRVFRLPEIGGIINRYGFNSDGHDAVFQRLSQLAPPGKRKGVVGINLGKNKESPDAVNDYVLGVRVLGPVADYLVINVSSPNTPALRDLQQKEALKNLTAAVINERNNLPHSHRPPLFLKISPDLSSQELKDIIEVISQEKHKVDGLIISNTTISRPTGVQITHMNEIGGLSGQPIKNLALSTLNEVSQLTKGQIPIIGVGGIQSGEDAKERIYNGASLIQIYSSLVYGGPPVVKRIANDLEDELRKDGHASLSASIRCKLR